MKIVLLHPFSAKAIGLKEADLLTSHSKPHVVALQAIERLNPKYSFSIDYFTGALYKKQKNINGVLKRFWPVSFPIKNRHQWRNQYSLWHYIFYNMSPPDLTIINMSGHGSKYIFKLAKKIKKKKKEYIAMIGGMNMTYNGEAFNYYSNAHHILVHTNYQLKELLNNPNFANFDIRVLPLGVDTYLFSPKKDLVEKDFIVTYVGRITPLKQIEIVINAIAYCKKKGLNNIKFNIIGPKSDLSYYNELDDLILELDCKDNIHFLGLISHDKLVRYYQKSTILALPSKHESFGMVMTEAMACGVPVIALKGAGGPDEIITDKVDGILSTKQLYAEDMFRMLSDKVLLGKMSCMARRKIEEEFSLDKTIEVLNQSLESIFFNK